MNKKPLSQRAGNPLLTILSTGLFLVSAAAAAITFNPPGNPANPNDATNILAFTQRDFVSASGYDAGDQVVVRVLHDPARYPGATGGTTAGTAGDLASQQADTGHWISPQGDPADPPATFSGIVEVNHPGGSCWLGQTPDIRAGDRVQIEIMANAAHPERVGRIDETYVRNVTAKRPVLIQAASPGNANGIVEIHGTAIEDTPGGPAGPLAVNLLEQRLVSPGNLFDLNNKRTLRATSVPGASNGILAYDAPGSTDWTARYSGLTADDIDRALGADSRGMWLGNATLPAVESTIYEIGALTFAGPTIPCTAPLEVLPPPPGSELIPPTDPTNLVAAISNSNTVTLTWDPSTDNVGVTAYGVYRNGQEIFTVQNDDASAPAPTTFVDPNTPPETYTYQVKAFDEVGNASGFSNTSNQVTAVPQLDVNNFPVNDPPKLPINIIAFPSRDFISPSGYEAEDTVTVQLLRNSPVGIQIVSSADGITPVDTDGVFFAEVNHPGGSCWQGVTPEIRAGDIVRTIAYNPASVGPGNPDGIRSIDLTTIAGVTAFKPVIVQQETTPGVTNDGIVQIHGTALGANGQHLPIDQIEQRMIATHGQGLFDLNSRRALRAAAQGAGGDGIIEYDAANNPAGINWTATYSGLSADDVCRVAGCISPISNTNFPGADTRIHWLGRNPLLLNEATIFENAPDTNPPGPAGPGCTRPLEAADVVNPSAPGNFQVSLTGNQANLSWSASTDDWYVAGYRVYDNGIVVANTGPSATSFTLGNLTPGNHVITLRAFDTASPRGPGAGIIAQISSGLGNLYGNLSDAASGGNQVANDVTAPSAPSITSTTIGVGTVTVNWSASIDNVGVDHYILHRNPQTSGQPADITVAGNVLTATDGEADPLAVGDYVYRVEAVDAAGNHSALSASVTVTVTETPDVTAPTVPANVVATNPNFGTTVNVSWAASTDEPGGSGLALYRIFRSDNGAAPAQVGQVSAPATTFTESPGSGSFSYTVAAVDAAGNASAKSAPAADVVIASATLTNGHALIAFPARDFISATGYDPAHTYRFDLVRGNTTYSTNALAPLNDGSGLIEANHPGASGTCWNVNTPDMRPGDLVRIVDIVTGQAEQTIVSNVTAERPIAINPNTVVIHGTAKEADGSPIPVDQLEHRLVTGTANAFDLNGRRTLRAGAAGDGTLVYDTVNNPTGTKWTATYTGLSANDVLRAVGGTSPTGTVFTGAESRAVWLGRAPLVLADGTIYEVGSGVVGGPAAPCTAPAETPVAAASLNQVSLSFPGTQFAPNQLTSASQNVLLSNGGGSPLTISNIYFAGANPGDFVITANTCPLSPNTLANGGSCTVSVALRPTTLGARQANLSVAGNAANTTDLSVALTGNGFDNTDPTITVAPTSKNFGTVNGGQTPSQVFTVTNTSNSPTGKSLTVSAAAIAGTNASDFSITTNDCIGLELKPADPANAIPAGTCSLTVQFAPGARTARSSTLTLTHNAAQPNGGTSTAIALSGTGGNGSVLSLNSGKTVTFGTVNRNTSKDQSISVKNSGNQAAALSLASFTVTGTGYSKVSTTCGNLAVNGSCNVVVRFTAPNVVNTFNGTLSVTAANGFPATATTGLTSTTK